MTRLSLRGRLTLLYGVLILLAGAAILAVLYLVVQDRLDRELGSGAADKRIAILREEAAASGNDTITTPDGTKIDIDALVAQIRQDREDIKDAALQTLLWQGSLVVAVIGVAAGAAGWITAGRGLLPLRRVTEVAERIATASGSERDLGERIGPTGGHDDLGRLAGAFDGMLAALQQSFDSQRRFVANASHELRTPLASERAMIELELTKPGANPETVAFAQTLLDLNHANSNLIERLLVLADSGNPIEHAETVDLAALVDDAIGSAAMGESPVSVRTELAPTETTGDPILLGQLVRNLIDNAIIHNLADGWVDVSTTTAGDDVVLRVINSGPRIKPDEVDGLFEPFRRNRADRTHHAGRQGFGLGLAIVSSVVTAHGGTISADARTTGGLDVAIRLPRFG